MAGELDTDSSLYDNHSKDVQIINKDSFKVRLSGILHIILITLAELINFQTVISSCNQVRRAKQTCVTLTD